MPKERLFFDHLYKTAGTSLNAAFAELFPGYVRIQENPGSHAEILKNRAPDFIGGHIKFLPGEKLSQNHYYCSVVRDPIEKFLSTFFYNRQVGSELINKGLISDETLFNRWLLASIRFNINEYVKLPSAHLSFSNIQAKHFASRITNKPHELNDRELLDAAISSLENYDLVGSQENLQGFISRIAIDFKRQPVLIPLLNVTRADEERKNISQETQKILKDGNRVDYHLIKWISERFCWGGQSKIPRSYGHCRENAHPLSIKIESSSISQTQDFGSKQIIIKSVNCYGSKSKSIVIDNEDLLVIDIDIEAFKFEENLTIGIAIKDGLNRIIYGTNTNIQSVPLEIKKLGKFRQKIVLENYFYSGAYSVTVALHTGSNHLDTCYHWLDNAAHFGVCILGVSDLDYMNCNAKFYPLEEFI